MAFTLGTVFNEDTEWEFTVSNERIETVVSGSGISESDITSYCFTALIDARCKAMVTESIRNTNDGLYPWALDYCAGYMSNSGANPCKVTMNVDKLTSEAVTCYERNLLTYYGNINGVTGHYLVMDMKNIKKWCINFDTTPIYTSGSVASTTGFPGYNGDVYVYSESNKARIAPYDPDSEAEDPIICNLRLVNVLTMNDSLWIGYLNPSSNSKELLANQYMVQQAWDTAYAAANTFNAGYPEYIMQGLPTSFQGWSNFSDADYPESTGQTQGFLSYLECDDSVHSLIKVSGQYGNNQSSYQTVNIEQGNLVKTLKDVHMIEAWCGLLFIDHGVLYKPLIENKIIIGFTSDMDRPSEWDDITNVTGNNISPTPPAPTPTGDEDNTDPVPTVGTPYSSGLARYYVTTAGSVLLQHISEAMGSWNLKDTGKDLYRNIISCKLIKPPTAIPTSGSEPFTVYGVTPEYEGSPISLPVISDNASISFGSYSIPRKFNDFRDYAPYTKVEIYLPYCGWTALPSHVVGRSVSVTYYTDIIAATCKAVVYCGANVVAEAAGVIGLDIPMVTENAGAKAEAVTMGLLSYGKAALQTAIGVGAAVATKGKAGVKQAVDGLGNVVSAYSQTAMAFNENWTEINGRNGDGCCIAGISAIVIKITRPKYGANTTAPYVPAMYGHSTGFLSMKSVKVGNVTGLLIADNVDTSGISGATDREKQLIKIYLESGVFVNHPS